MRMSKIKINTNTGRVRTGQSSVFNRVKNEVSFEILLVMLVDCVYSIQYYYLSVYFEAVTYEQFFILKVFYLIVQFFETYFQLTSYYYNQTLRLYNNVYVTRFHGTKCGKCIEFSGWTFDDCDEKEWLNRLSIDIAIKFIASHVGMIYIGIRIIIARFTNWESSQYDGDSDSDFDNALYKRISLLLVSFVIDTIVYSGARFWFYKMYHSEMIHAFYEFVNQSRKLKKKYFWALVIVSQFAIWMW